MIDGQMNVERRDVDVSHNAVAGDIKLILIVFRCPQKGFVTKGIAQLCSRLDCFIVGNGKFLCLDNCAVIHLLYLLLILSVDLRLVFLVVDSTDDGIKGHAKCQQESNDGNADS